MCLKVQDVGVCCGWWVSLGILYKCSMPQSPLPKERRNMLTSQVLVLQSFIYCSPPCKYKLHKDRDLECFMQCCITTAQNNLTLPIVMLNE